MVDADLLRRKLADLDLYLRQVAEFRGVTVEEYGRDWKVQRIVERTARPPGPAVALGVVAPEIGGRGRGRPW